MRSDVIKKENRSLFFYLISEYGFQKGLDKYLPSYFTLIPNEPEFFRFSTDHCCSDFVYQLNDLLVEKRDPSHPEGWAKSNDLNLTSYYEPGKFIKQWPQLDLLEGD